MPAPSPDLADLVDRAAALARRGRRADLVARLARTRSRIDDPEVRVVVAGEIKQGKSLLLNALVNAPVCPVDDDVATVVTTVLRHGATPSALARPAGAEPYPVHPTALADYVSERGNPGNRRGIDSVEVRLPRELLSGGLVLVDAPGVGGLSSLHSVTALSALASADAALVVTDAGSPLSDPELRFVGQALRLCPTVVCVITKTDLHPAWREVVAADRAALDRIRPGIPVVPVSSTLRTIAARTGDAELNAESGFPGLVAQLRGGILGRARTIRRRAVVRDVVAAIGHLRVAAQAELDALERPADAPAAIARLESARRRGEGLTQRSAAWQTALSDGIGDLIADMEYDLRDRLRSIQHEAEVSIDDGDPGPAWGAFVEWLEERVAAAVSETFVWTDERARWLAAEVGRRFADEDVAVPGYEFPGAEAAMEPVDLLPDLDDGRLSLVDKVLIGMRGSYGGVLMIGLLTGVLGMALINPFSLGAGLLIGAKAYKEESAARLRRRRNEAKSHVRRLVDDVVFHVGKELRDRLREVQRTTRDHFAALAEESRRTAVESVHAVGGAERDPAPAARIAELRRRLDELEGLRAHALSLLTASPEREHAA